MLLQVTAFREEPPGSVSAPLAGRGVCSLEVDEEGVVGRETDGILSRSVPRQKSDTLSQQEGLAGRGP